jgi:thymidylate kinase
MVILGPDGAGKSTLIQGLVEITRPIFPEHQLFHWRPAALWRRKHRADVTKPHGKPPHSTSWSVVRVFAHFMDYWFGYFTKIKPILSHSGLVVFDRYFYDLAVDPLRYRYGGPRWLLSALIPFVPKPHLTLVLDASEHTVRARKQELEPDDLRRLRHRYRELAARIPGTEVIAADQEIDQVLSRASDAVTRLLIRRSNPLSF